MLQATFTLMLNFLNCIRNILLLLKQQAIKPYYKKKDVEAKSSPKVTFLKKLFYRLNMKVLHSLLWIPSRLKRMVQYISERIIWKHLWTWQKFKLFCPWWKRYIVIPHLTISKDLYWNTLSIIISDSLPYWSLNDQVSLHTCSLEKAK